MATNRTINSPGVQITETDLSQIAPIGGATNILVPGYASQGPTDEIIMISSQDELEQVYGMPETPAERYFYYSCKEVLNSPATLLTTRLAYGSANGDAFSDKFSALLYPVSATATGFNIAAPTSIVLNQTQYNNIVQNNITWVTTASASTTPSYTGTTLDAGIIVINSAQVATNEASEGYYVAIQDNNTYGAGNSYTGVTAVYGLSGASLFAPLPTSRLAFALSATSGTFGTNSISEQMENIPTFNFGLSAYDDSLILGVFKLRTSSYQSQTLAASLVESYVGSLNQAGVNIVNGVQQSSYLSNVVNAASTNIQLFVNPSIAQAAWQTANSLNPALQVVANDHSLRTYGVYVPTYNTTSRDIGDVSAKLSRVSDLVSIPEDQILDIVVDAGLSTIFATTSSGSYDDTVFMPTLSAAGTPYAQRWQTITNIFTNLTQNIRRDCMTIIDPPRHIFVNGNTKVVSVVGNNFTQNIYTPLTNTFGAVNTSYGAAYGNWVQVYDSNSGKNAWVPFSGYAAAIYARTDKVAQPWIAPAGLNRGTFSNVIDIAFNPNQKQRDALYTMSIKPVVFFKGDGYTVWGQKTLQALPSAFDRVNVRRLFLTLERVTNNALRYFVFEPNTEFTRTRLVNTLTPVFELAKNTEGVYAYKILCDESNNTPDVIDQNELAVSIYLQPVRAGEFILVNFVATRTGQNFQELI